MPRLPRSVESLIPYFVVQATPALRDLPFVRPYALDPEKHRVMLHKAWRAFLTSLYSQGARLSAQALPSEAVEPVQRGRMPSSIAQELSRLVREDAGPMVQAFVDGVLKDGYAAGILMLYFEDVRFSLVKPPAVLREMLERLVKRAAWNWMNDRIVELLPEDGVLFPVAPETYAAVMFSMLLEEMRAADTNGRPDARRLFRRHMAMLAAAVAAGIALRRCMGLRATGIVEAFMLRDLAKASALSAHVPSWWQWLVSPRPRAVVNQMDRMAAVERLFFQAFVSVPFLARRAAVDGPAPGIEPQPVLLARTEPRIDLFLQDADEVTGDMAWLLATRAPQAAWLEAAKEGRHVEPVKRWRERWEAGDDGVKAALASLAPRATELRMSADRFASVAYDWMPLLRGAVAKGVTEAPSMLEMVPAMFAEGRGEQLSVEEAVRRTHAAGDAWRRLRGEIVVSQGVEEVAPADPLVEKFFSALEQASTGALPVAQPEPDVAVMQNANQQVYQPPEEDPEILEALKPVDPAAVFGEDYVEGNDAVMPVADAEGNDAVMPDVDRDANRLPNVRSVDALSVPDDIGDDWR